MHYTERCIEVRPCYLFDKLEVVNFSYFPNSGLYSVTSMLLINCISSAVIFPI